MNGFEAEPHVVVSHGSSACGTNLPARVIVPVNVCFVSFLFSSTLYSVCISPLSGHRNEYVFLSAINGRTDRRLESSAFQMPIASALQPFSTPALRYFPVSDAKLLKKSQSASCFACFSFTDSTSICFRPVSTVAKKNINISFIS